MTLTKTLPAAAEERFRTGQLGKYMTMAHAATANTGFDPTTVYTDKTLIADRGLDFAEAKLEQIRATTGGNYTIASLESCFVVYLRQFIAGGNKLKIVTRPSGVKLTATVASDTDAADIVAFNGSFCALGTVDEIAAKVTPVDPAVVTPVGFVYSNGAQIAGGRASADGFHLQYAGQLDFGPGDATGGDGIGGLTPILLKKADLNKVWKYGEKNVYSPDLPTGSTPAETGEPSDIDRPYLLVRSSRQYKAANRDAVGKVIFAYVPTKDMALVLVQPNNPINGGKTLDIYRDVLFGLKCEYAVGMDGSDSVMLYEYKTKKLFATPGTKKDNYLEVAVLARS